jgi:hypothetical protein
MNASQKAQMPLLSITVISEIFVGPQVSVDHTALSSEKVIAEWTERSLLRCASHSIAPHEIASHVVAVTIFSGLWRALTIVSPTAASRPPILPSSIRHAYAAVRVRVKMHFFQAKSSWLPVGPS